MTDLLAEQLYGGKYNRYGGEPEDADDVDEDFFAGGYGDDKAEDIMQLGGAKKENEVTFCVESASVGTYEGGRFVSTSAYNAAKKAATAIFRHNDKSAKGGKKAAKTIQFILYRNDRKKAVKYYSYEATRVVADKPLEVKRYVNKGTSNQKVITIKFTQKVSLKTLDLTAEYENKNKEEQKVFAAKKRAAKRKAEAAANPDKKQRKPKAAAKTKKSSKPASVEDLIKALTVSGEKKKSKAVKKPKAEKKSKAEKKPKSAAAKKPKTKKGMSGGGYCSFF